jgi:hypothetical protein
MLIEAKGGYVSQGTWKDPKELSYFRFLKECKVPGYKGFAYVIPAQYTCECLDCLGKYFSPSESVMTGFLLWEELLPLIYDKLMETAIDQVIKEMDGLRHLREWRRLTH